MADICALCHGNKGWHQRAQQQLHAAVARELVDARFELACLERLYKDILWYNLEVWNAKRRHGEQYGTVVLRGHRRVAVGRSNRIERNLVVCAPRHEAAPIPHDILEKECEEAQSYVDWLCSLQFDAYHYAPGGSKYEELCKRTSVGKLSNDSGNSDG